MLIQPRIAIVTGIYPPDIGGPATHVYDVTCELRSRGFLVTVVSLRDERSAACGPGLVRFRRSWPWPVRSAMVVAWLAARRRRYDVIYAAGMHAEAVTGAFFARRPVVVKVVGDRAWERGRRLGLVREGFDEFQRASGGSWRLRAMRCLRTLTVRRATAVIAPSRYLAQVVDGWLEAPGATVVVPNGVRLPEGSLPSADPSDRPLRAVFVGRLVGHKHVEVLIEAVATTRRVTLEVVGEGPEEVVLKKVARHWNVADRVSFAGRLGHDAVIRRLAASHVLVTAGSYEGLPHTVIEALACGTPVVASAAGGTTEAVKDGANGLVVDPAVPAGFAAALGRLRDDPALLAGLAEGAVRTSRDWSLEACVDRLVAVLSSAAGSRGDRPRAVFVGKAVTNMPPSHDLQEKCLVLNRHLLATLVAVGRPGLRKSNGVRLLVLPRLRPALAAAAAHYALAPVIGVLLAAGRRPAAVVCQSPYEGFASIWAARFLPRRIRPAVVVEVHGDWRTAARMYGGAARRPLAPVAAAVAGWSLRRADRVRAVGVFTSHLARQAGYAGPLDAHVAFSDFEAFLGMAPMPLPEAPQVAFVGGLERPKAPEVLIEAWSIIGHRHPGARLVLAGEGRMRATLQRRVDELGLGASVVFLGPISRVSVAELLDASWCLVLPSRSEGLPRVVLEAMARARPVVASDVGGIAELVEDGATGFLVAPGDPVALADSLLRLLSDPALAAELGRRGRAVAEQRDPAREFDEGTARLAGWIAERGRER